MSSFRSTAIFPAGILFAVFAGCVARIYFAGEPLWIDELHTAWSIDSSLTEVAGRAGQGNQTPLYFWISWLVSCVLGLTEFSLRLPSLLFSTAAIVWAGFYVRRLTNSGTAAITTSLLIALDHWFIFYGSECRPYALLQLLSIIQIDCLTREFITYPAVKLKHNVSSLISWPLVVSTVALLATHYTSLFLIAIELSFIAACTGSLHWKRSAASLLIASSVVIFMLPAIVSTFNKQSDWQTVSDTSKLFSETWTSLLIYFVVPACLKFFCGGKKTFQSIGPIMWLVLCWGFGPLLIVALLSLIGNVSIASYRYTLVGSAAFPIFAGLAISQCSEMKWEAIGAIAIVTVALLFNPILHSLIRDPESTRFRHEDWKSAVELINSELAGSDQIVFQFANLVEDHRAGSIPLDPAFADYLKFPLTGIYKLEEESTIVPMPALSDARWQTRHIDLIQDNRTALMVIRADRHLVDSILMELKEKVAPDKLNLEVKTQPANILTVVKIELVVL